VQAVFGRSLAVVGILEEDVAPQPMRGPDFHQAIVAGLRGELSSPGFDIELLGRPFLRVDHRARHKTGEVQPETPLEGLEQLSGGNPIGKLAHAVGRRPMGQPVVGVGQIDSGPPERRDLGDRPHEPGQQVLRVAADLQIPGDLEQGHRPPAHPAPFASHSEQAEGRGLELLEIDGLGQDIVDGFAHEPGQGLHVEGSGNHQDGDIEIRLPDPLDEVVSVAVFQQVVDEHEVKRGLRVGGEAPGQSARRDRFPARGGVVAFEQFPEDRVVVDDQNPRSRWAGQGEVDLRPPARILRWK